MMILVTMFFPAIYLQCVPLESGSLWRGVFDVSVFTLATLSASVFYVASQYELFRDWRTGLKFLPMLMALGVGLCVSNTTAILEALFGKKSEFVRTPKYGGNIALRDADRTAVRTRRRRNWLPYAEFIFGLYMSACVVCSIVSVRAALTAPFLVMFAFGFFYVSVMTFQGERARRTAPDAEKQPAKVRA
jgi:hypothetical protein